MSVSPIDFASYIDLLGLGDALLNEKSAKPLTLAQLERIDQISTFEEINEEDADLIVSNPTAARAYFAKMIIAHELNDNFDSKNQTASESNVTPIFSDRDKETIEEWVSKQSSNDYSFREEFANAGIRAAASSNRVSDLNILGFLEVLNKGSLDSVANSFIYEISPAKQSDGEIMKGNADAFRKFYKNGILAFIEQEPELNLNSRVGFNLPLLDGDGSGRVVVNLEIIPFDLKYKSAEKIDLANNNDLVFKARGTAIAEKWSSIYVGERKLIKK